MKKIILGVIGVFVLLGILIFTEVIRLPENSPAISIKGYYIADEFDDKKLDDDKQYLAIAYTISNRTKKEIADNDFSNPDKQILVLNKNEYKPDYTLYETVFSKLRNIDGYKEITELSSIPANTGYDTLVPYIVSKKDVSNFANGEIKVLYNDSINEVNKIIASDFIEVNSIDKIAKVLKE